jgi:hypothetical protein
MSVWARVGAVLMLVVAVMTSALPVAVGAAQDDAPLVDLAAMPLAPTDLPDQGYQVMTGGFLDRNATAAWIAGPRNEEPAAVEEMLENGAWDESYALDLVLLADRAYADSDILALVQTNLYRFADDGAAEDAFDALKDYSSNPDAEETDSPVTDGATVRLVTESGDTLRTLARVDDVVVEVVSLEQFQQVDTATHGTVAIDTVDRAIALRRAGAVGVATHALLIADGAEVADLFNAPATGVHQVYRLRDDVVQPAAGELEAPERDAIAPGLRELFQGSQGVRIGDGTGFFSSWIGTFQDDASAAAFVAGLPTASSGALLPDPYFPLWADEEASAQGVAGVYRVSGTATAGRFSGTVEIRQHGPYVVGIGWRAIGDVLPSVDVTSRLMDAQLACLDAGPRCAPMPVAMLMEPGMATPVVATPGGQVVSAEFGWSLSFDPASWTAGEQFAQTGYDYVELRSGESMVTLESVVDQHGDPPQCVVDQLHQLQTLEEHAVIDLGSDVAEGPPAGMETGHAWAIYTVEPLAEERADQEYTIRIDCYTLVEGAASLVMTQTAPRDRWAEEQPKGDVLRQGIVIPVGEATDAVLAGERPIHWRHGDAMINKIWIGLAA